MTIADVARPGKRLRFGVFARLGEVFTLAFRRRPGVFVGLGFLLFLVLPVGFVSALGATMDYFDPDATLAESGIETILIGLAVFVAMLSWLLGASVLTLTGCDEMAGRRRQLAACFRRALGRLPHVLLLGLFAAVLVMLGALVLGVLGLWVSACFAVFLPALLWEDAKWGALTRSQRLTKNYRWPIVGLILVLYLGNILLFFGFAFVIDQVPERDTLFFDIVLATPILIQILLLPVFCAVPPVVHARLRVIKEGDTEGELRAVFE